jgi:hypothetical protein
MKNDPYELSKLLCAELRTSNLEDWAVRIEDVVQGGSTGSEILMGLKWVLGELVNVNSLEKKVQILTKTLFDEVSILLR